MNEKEIEECVLWYTQQKPVYALLADKIAEIIEEVLDSEKIIYSSIECREKEVEKFKDKISEPISFKPREMQDLAGIRIICYVNSDVEKITKLMKEIFDIDESKSIDKTKTLGVDKMGYRGVHLVAKLPKERTRLHEFKKFEGLYFEIQIRTILQHSWAEIQHDKNYKFSGTLAPEIQRRFNLISTNLEMADNEFNTLSQLIEEYSQDVSQKTKAGNLDIPINSTSLRQFLTDELECIKGMEIEYNFGPGKVNSKEIIEELKIMGIKTLKDLKEIIPLDFKDKIPKYEDYTNFSGFIRAILMIHNPEKYFKEAWRNSWQGYSQRELGLYTSYGIDMIKVFDKYGIDFYD